MAIPGAADQIIQVLAAWPGVEAHPHRFGGTEYRYLPIANVLYAANAAAIGLAMSALWWYAFRGHRLVDASLDPKLIRTVNLRALVAPVVFGVSILLAAQFIWRRGRCSRWSRRASSLCSLVYG